MDILQFAIEQIGPVVKAAFETLSILLIAAGGVVVVWKMVRALFQRDMEIYRAVRITFARFLVLSLELQLAADIVATAISFDWQQVGKLGAIAVIRTLLNYFLQREIEQDRERQIAAQSNPS